jgi:hypothetical protein
MQFIQVYEKAFSDEYCNQVIEWFKVAEENGMTLNRQLHDGVPKTDKEDLYVHLPYFPMERTNPKLITEFNRVFWGECYKQYAEKYSILNTFSQHNSYTMKIQKTKPGQGYHIWHAEATNRESANVY